MSDVLVPISALQHYAYCPRQCALIHVDRVFDENVHTARGQRMHRRVDQPGHETAEGVRVERAMALHAPALGVVGKADIVEFSADGTPRPVEYKSGSRVRREADDIQVAAQAMALEEMLGVDVPHGCVMHHASRRRRDVVIDEDLRGRVYGSIDSVRRVMGAWRLPNAVNDARCPQCSLIDICLPDLVATEGRSDPSDPTFEPPEVAP